MRRVSRKFKRHFGVSAKHVAVRAPRIWYWQVLTALAYITVGYLFAYWHLTGGDFGSLTNSMMRITHDNQQLQDRAVQTERQLQVAQAAQSNLAKALSDMQDESLRLKEDVTFYKNILSENDNGSELRIYSFKLAKGAQQRQYEYHILLVQSGRHDKLVQGSVKLMLNATQSGQAVKLPLSDGANSAQAIAVNFKYYQRIDGTFILPQDAEGHSVELNFMEPDTATRPKISQKIDLPV